jgi:perosamine synthetase
MDRLLAIGEKHGIPVIEDAAEAIGSVYHGKRAGSMGRFGVFSFHGTKTLTTGEGGMFVTNDSELYDRVLTLSNHGRVRGQTKQFWPDMIGFKYKISNIQAAIGCAQMERIESLISAKRHIFKYYADAFSKSPVAMNPEPPGIQNGFWMPTIVVNEEVNFSREKLLSDFSVNHVDGRVFFWPLSMLPMFNEKRENVISYSTYERGINLPSYHDLNDKQMDRIIDLVIKNITYK